MKAKFSSGSVFGIPLKNGQFLLGQILQPEPLAMNSLACALFDQIFQSNEPPPSPDPKQIFAVLLVTPDRLQNRDWKILGQCPLAVPPENFPYAETRKDGFIGAKIIGSGIVEKFAGAYKGLLPWDKWHDPNYLDSLLVNPEKKPAKLLLVRSGGADPAEPKTSW